jgi:hypothetical protein
LDEILGRDRSPCASAKMMELDCENCAYLARKIVAP